VGSVVSSLEQTEGGGRLTFWLLGGLEVNIGGQLQNDLTPNLGTADPNL
jgi:hypothetical protein